MPAVMAAIDKMTTAEKVEIMNYLWAAVASAGERFVPVWHVEGSMNALKPMPRRVSQYGALKDKISYMAPDFDEPLEDFAEYM